MYRDPAARVLLLAFNLIFCGCSPPGAQEESVRIGTSSVGSTYYSIAIGISEIVSGHAGINATAEPMGGSLPNIHGLNQGMTELALSNAYPALLGFNGEGRFDSPVDIRLVMQGHGTYRWLVLRTDAGIDTVADLEGKTIVARRPALPELELVMDAIISAHGLDRDSIRFVRTANTRQTFRLLHAGSVDGAMLPFSFSSSLQRELEAGNLKLLRLSEVKRDEILNLLPPVFWRETLAPGTLDGQEQAIPLVGMNTYFIARGDVSDEIVYRVTKALLKNRDQFESYHNVIRQWTVQRTLNSPRLPFHEGSIQYFREAGVWTDELERLQLGLLSEATARP